MKNILFILVIPFLFGPTGTNAGWFGANNRDECILESMKGVTSDMAARIIYDSCDKKFPAKPPSTKEVPQSVLIGLTQTI